MWRSFPPRPLLRALPAAALNRTAPLLAEHWTASAGPRPPRLSSAAAPPDTPEGASAAEADARRLMRLVDAEALKRRLAAGGAEVAGYAELLAECAAAAPSREEAAALARELDQAGVVLLFGDKVYLHPDKVVDLVRKAVPLALTPDDDPRREELKEMLKKKEVIDRLAHKQVRQILWSGLGFFIVQLGLFFRLTFWEFSWDVMEPIAFFTTATGLLVGYSYFLITSRDPTYQDFMERLFSSRQRKLCQKLNFNMQRFMELQKHRKFSFDRHIGCAGLQSLHRNGSKVSPWPYYFLPCYAIEVEGGLIKLIAVDLLMVSSFVFLHIFHAIILSIEMV